MENLPFWNKFETFDREIYKQIPKIYLTASYNYHDIQHIKWLLWHLAVLIYNSLKKWSLKALNLVQNDDFSILSI